jgi:DNA-binding CsgD family transcriptional regulator
VSAPTTPKKTPLTGGQQYALALAVTGMLAVGAYGLVISYWTVRELAVKLHMPLPHIFPIGIEGGMIAVLAIDIVLTWIGRPIGWLRQVARALSATAISINAYAGWEYGVAAVVMHALAPAILIVGVEALRHHLLVVLQVPEEKEPIPRGRWLLAPVSTVAMWRRMVLWQQPRYSEALDTHLDRHEAIAELKRAFGWRWKQAIPAGLAYRLSVGVRLEESTAEVRELLVDHYAQTEQAEARTTRVYAHDVTAWVEPVRVPLGARTHTVVGGDRADGHVDPGPRQLLPIECAATARARAAVLAEGARAVAQIEDWRAREQASATRTRMRAEALATAAGGTRRALPAREHIVPEQESDRPVRVPERERAHDGEVPPGRVLPAVEARRRAGLATRERIAAHIAAHPGHTAEQIAVGVGVHVTTVRRHLRDMRDGS